MATQNAKADSGGGFKSVDKVVLAGAGAVCLIVIIGVLINPANAENFFNMVFASLTSNFGWLYMIAVSVFVVFSIWLGFGKFGKIKLGEDDSEPDFKFSSWFFMMFASGMGIGLVFYSVAEPMSVFLAPPYGDPETIEAAKTAMAYSYLHWGIHPWACFVVVGAALAYFSHRRGMPALISTTFIPLVGKKNAEGVFGSVMNILAVIVTVFGVATSLGMGAMQITAGLGYVFDVPGGNVTMLIIVAIATVLFGATAVSGVEKGINTLATINIWLLIALTIFILFAGNTPFLINFFSDSIGNYLNIFVHDSFWTDSFGQTDGWVGGWTVFFWAWWIAWAPFVGGFLARVSKGRTIRQFVVGTLFLPTVASMLFLAFVGGSALDLSLAGNTAIGAATAENISFGLFETLKSFPIPVVLSMASMLLLFIFFLTSANSATFVCTMLTTRGVQNPPKSVIAFWSVILGGVSAVLLMAGGLKACQTSSIVAAFPFSIAMIAMMFSLIKALNQEIDPETGRYRKLEEVKALESAWNNEAPKAKHPAPSA